MLMIMMILNMSDDDESMMSAYLTPCRWKIHPDSDG